MPLTEDDIARAATASVAARRAAYTSDARLPAPAMTADAWELHLARVSLLAALETLWPEGECPPWLRQTEKET